MILSFKPQFKQPILDGIKIHTIREDPHDRWKPGMKIHMATGVRTKNYDCFMEAECVSVEYIFMSNVPGVMEISIGDDPYCDKYLYFDDKEKLARKDGFGSYAKFQDWFRPLIENHPKKHFYGKIIHWTDFKYN